MKGKIGRERNIIVVSRKLSLVWTVQREVSGAAASTVDDFDSRTPTLTTTIAHDWKLPGLGSHAAVGDRGVPADPASSVSSFRRY